MKKWFVKGVAIALAMSMTVNLYGFSVMAAGMNTGTAVIAEAAEGDQVYVMNNTMTLIDEAGNTVTQLQGNCGTAAGNIKVDASAAGAKFAPRANDTQVNAGTVLSVPIAANTAGAVVTAKVSGGTGSLQCGEAAYTVTTSAPAVIELDSLAEAGECVIEVSAQTYLSEITVTYNQPEAAFPGEAGNVAKVNKIYTLNTSMALTDEAGSAVTQLQGNKGAADDIKVDASAAGAKFAPRTGDTQINAGTVLYVPIAANEKGAVMTVMTSGGTPAVTINGTAYNITTSVPAVVELEASASAQYCVVEVTAQSYLKEISVAYKDNEAAFPGVPEAAEAKDTAYALNNSMALTDLNGNTATQIQSGKGIACEAIKVDATKGKFAPRTGDTQINAGTVLYIPVAPDAKGATITVSGNNNGNLPLKWNGTSISAGTETVFETPETAAYYALEFGGETGSCYATGIAIDYKSDDTYVENIVTVGVGKQYQTIKEALAANHSSVKERLTLVIDPGDYLERVIVEDPYVSFKNAEPSKGDVVIHERYYSSNMRKADGSYDPQDEYDLGTAECGTVIVKGNAAGFTADHITFKNDYNMTYKTESGTQTPAVALNTRADKVVLTNCKILGRQDTFYPQGAGCRVVLKDCYIEGTVDFIFGDADTYFEDCQIHMAAFTGRDSGYFVAPNTKMDNTGLVFYNCKLTVDDSYTNAEKISLGRPWQTECESTVNEQNQMVSLDVTKKKAGYEKLGSAATFIECQMTDMIKASRFSSWTRKLYNEEYPDGKTVVVSYDQDVRFAEINTKNLSGELIATPEELTPSTTVFKTELTAGEVEKELTGYKKDMAIGEGTTWTPELEESIKIAAPEIVSAVSKSQTSVKVTWKSVKDADGYQLMRAERADGMYKCIKTIKDGKAVSYTNTGLTAGQTYYYKVRAYALDKKNNWVYSDYSACASAPGTVIVEKAYSNAENRVRLIWKAVDSADGYQIWRKSADKPYAIVKSIKDGSVSAYSNVDLVSGCSYTYKIRAYKKVGEATIWGAYSDEITVTTKPGKSVLTVERRSGEKAVLTWTAVDGAAGYQIWRADASGEYKIVKSIVDGDTVRYVNNGLTAGETYSYKVRAYAGSEQNKVFGEYSDSVDVAVK